MPGFPVLHHLPKFVQVHVHCIGDAIQPSHPLSPSSPSTFNLSQHQGFIPKELAVIIQSIGTSVSTSVLPMSIQGWFPLRLTGLISLLCPGNSQESSPAPQFESNNSSALCLLYGLALTTICDYWKDNSLDYTDLCRQSDIFAFKYTV